MKSTIEIDGPCPNVSNMTLASTASTAAIDSDETIAAADVLADLGVDAPRTRGTCRRGSGCRAGCPSAPKTLPRIPIAAGTSTSRPGSISSVLVIDPSVMPVTRSPPDEIRSAMKPARTPAKSARTSATNRAPTRRGRRNIGDSAGLPSEILRNPTSVPRPHLRYVLLSLAGRHHGRDLQPSHGLSPRQTASVSRSRRTASPAVRCRPRSNPARPAAARRRRRRRSRVSSASRTSVRTRPRTRSRAASSVTATPVPSTMTQSSPLSRFTVTRGSALDVRGVRARRC